MASHSLTPSKQCLKVLCVFNLSFILWIVDLLIDLQCILSEVSPAAEYFQCTSLSHGPFLHHTLKSPLMSTINMLVHEL